MKTTLYVYAAQANQYTPQGVNFASFPGVCLALSEEEAVGIGLRRARERWPVADGWVSHTACAFQVPEEFIERVRGAQLN